jgi:hypothetical protein
MTNETKTNVQLSPSYPLTHGVTKQTGMNGTNGST